jgi:acyl dehydratase
MSQVYFEDLEAGDEITPLPKTPTREQIREYASLSTLRQGRFSSDDDAKGEGLQGMIVPGNMSMSFLSQLLTDWAGPEGNLVKLEVNFRRMVNPGDILLCKAMVTDIEEINGTNQVILDAYIENQDGERPVQGIASVILPNRR